MLNNLSQSRTSSVFLGLLLLTSCSSARIKYEAQVESADGKARHYTFEKSLDVTSIAVLCGVSAWYFGGACWYYFAMPTTYQKNQTEKEALLKLEELLKSKSYKIISSKLDQTSWKAGADEAELKERK